MNTKARDFAITMAYDAFRIAMGRTPRIHSIPHVMLWLKLTSKGINERTKVTLHRRANADRQG